MIRRTLMSEINNAAAEGYRLLSRRLERCDRVIQKESDDSLGGNV